MLGGIMRADEHYTGGSLAVDMLKKFTFNKAFLGISAISGRDVMTSNIEEGIIMSTNNKDLPLTPGLLWARQQPCIWTILII